MATSIRFVRFLLFSGLLLIAVLNLSTVCCAAGLLVPAYFYPGTGGPGGVGDGWSAMDTAAAKVHLTAIFNPNSGPGPSVDPKYVHAITNLEAAGGKVVAYVFSDFGNAPIATVEAQINTYISQYGSLIQGVFVDGSFITPSTLSYYQSLDAYIKGLSSSYLVMSNPGQPFLNGVMPANYLSTADIFNIFEGTDSQFAAYPNGQNWFMSYPGNRFANIVYNVPISSLQSDLNRAHSLNAGSVFITDGTLPGPYSQLPSYWDQEVADIGKSTPEPSSISLLLLSGLLAVPYTALKRGRSSRSRN